MRQVTGNMTSVVKGMDKAMETMNLERVRPSLPPSPSPNLQSSPNSHVGVVFVVCFWTDLARDGQVRVAVRRFGRPDVLHGGRDGLDDGRVHAAGSGGHAHAADGGGGQYRATAGSRGQGGARPRPAAAHARDRRGGRQPRGPPTRAAACDVASSPARPHHLCYCACLSSSLSPRLFALKVDVEMYWHD